MGKRKRHDNIQNKVKKELHIYRQGYDTGAEKMFDTLQSLNEHVYPFYASMLRIDQTIQLSPNMSKQAVIDNLVILAPEMTAHGVALYNLCISDGYKAFESYADECKTIVSQYNDEIAKVIRGDNGCEVLRELTSAVEINQLTAKVIDSYKRNGWQSKREERLLVGKRAVELQLLRKYKGKCKNIRTGEQILIEFSSDTATEDQKEAYKWLKCWADNDKGLGKEIGRAMKDYKATL